jgi:hypothetical protein
VRPVGDGTPLSRRSERSGSTEPEFDARLPWRAEGIIMLLADASTSRYLRIRKRHRDADVPWLWLGNVASSPLG